MWITCNDAINRYDGKMVKVYNLDRYFNGCPNLQQGYGFTEDDQGNIYIGSVRGLYIYHRNQDRFTLQKVFRNASDAIAMPIAFKEGKVWCFNKQFQLSTYDVKTKKVTLVTQLKINPLASVHIYELSGNVFYNHYPFMDNAGKLWFIGNNEILEFDSKTSKSYFPLQEYTTKNKPTFFSSCYDKYSNSLFCGTKNGVLEYNITNSKIIETNIIDQKKLGNVTNLCVNKDLIAIKSNFSVILINKVNRKDYLLLFNESNKLNWTHNFGFDKSNRLWVCDDGKGQVILDFHPKLLNKIPNESSKINYFSNSGVGRFAELPDKQIVIPIIYKNKNFLIKYDKETNKIYSAPSPLLSETSFYGSASDVFRKGIWFYAEYADGDNQVLKIFFYDQNGNVKIYFKQNNFKELGHQQDMEVFPNGKILCSFTKGLFWLHPETNSLEKIDVKNQNNLFKINVLDEKEIAISYLNNDMLLFKMQSDTKFNLVQKILPGIQSFYMKKDSKKNHYWVGTNQGVYLLDAHFKTIKIFNANNGLAGTYIYGLLLDDEGNVYCSHQRGLSSIDAKTYQLTNFDKNDGIQDWDFNNRAFYKATDGTLYFGGVSGFNYFKPPLKPYSYYKPEVYIDEIFVNNKQYSNTVNANMINILILNYKENNISIKAIVKDLANANARQLIYRIKEIDAKWKYLTNGSVIVFNNLSPNNYTLQLGTYDKYTNKEIHQKTLLILISTPFYSKIWFWTLIAFLCSGFIFWGFNQRKLQRQKNIFQQKLALEQQRNKITADLHDDIGATLSSLQINSAVANQLLNKNPKEAQKVLEKIETQSQNLADKMGDIIWSLKPGKEEFMTMSTRIKNFVNEILGSTDIKYSIHTDPILDNLIKDITLRKNIILIIKEGVNNVAKYSKASQLDIKLGWANNIISIEIIDNGIGFEINDTSGNGITNMRKRVEELKGDFNIISKSKLGTTIFANIPFVP